MKKSPSNFAEGLMELLVYKEDTEKSEAALTTFCEIALLIREFLTKK